MNTLTDAQCAYLAGFFDSKGCISITKTQSSANRTPSYVLRVIFSQSGDQGLSTLNSFRNLTGLGTLNHYISSKYGNMQHEWRLVSRDAAEVLTVILPYLATKKDQALVAIEFIKLTEANKHGGRGYVVPQEVVEKKEICFLALRIVKEKEGDPLTIDQVAWMTPRLQEVLVAS